MSGLPYPPPLAGYGLGTPKIQVPGTARPAGLVVAASMDVTRLYPGDEVFGVGQGHFRRVCPRARGQAGAEAGGPQLRTGGVGRRRDLGSANHPERIGAHDERPCCATASRSEVRGLSCPEGSVAYGVAGPYRCGAHGAGSRPQVQPLLGLSHRRDQREPRQPANLATAALSGRRENAIG